MRVLHVVPRYPPAIGGAETWCAGLARWQAAHGEQVEVLTLRAVREEEVWSGITPVPGACALGRTDVAGGVRLRRCAHGALGSTLLHLLARTRYASLACGHSAELYGLVLRAAPHVDVVHAHGVPGVHGLAACVAARVARRPWVLTPHLHPLEPAHQAPLVSWLLHHADGLTADTSAEADALAARGVRGHRITEVSTAVDPAPYAGARAARAGVRAALGVSAGVPLLCFVGRKAPTKDLEVLLAAFGRLRHVPPPVLVLAGPSTPWYRAVALPVGRIVDLPALSEQAKIALLGAADLLVLPSRNEAFGIVFLEAWAASLAVVGADVAAIREVLGDAGRTFRAGDPQALAAAIDAALADPDATAAQVARGRARMARQHTWDHVGPMVAAAYRRAGAREAEAR